ncbi:MAG: hypothetical protein AAB478_03660 [Patescibacteria group bacterium]
MDRERKGIFQRARGVVSGIVDSRESAMEKIASRDRRLDEIGGVGAVSHMALHEIEEHFGIDQQPISAYGTTYPSLAEMRRNRSQREERADRNLARRLGELPGNQTLFERIQGYYVEKARSKRDSSIEVVSQEQGE